MDYKVVTKSDFTAVSLATVRNYLKFEDTNATEDSLITSLINAAVEKIESYCNISLRARTIEVLFEDFDIDEGSVILPVANFSSLTSLYIVYDGVGTIDSNPICSSLNVAEVKSNAWYEGAKIKVRYETGAVASDIANLAVLKSVAEWFENRDQEYTLNGEVRKLLNQISYQPWI